MADDALEQSHPQRHQHFVESKFVSITHPPRNRFGVDGLDFNTTLPKKEH